MGPPIPFGGVRQVGRAGHGAIALLLPIRWKIVGRAVADMGAKTGNPKTRRGPHTACVDVDRSTDAFERACEAIEYHDFPTVEWTLWFTNTAKQDSPALSDVPALDASFPCSGGRCLLRWLNGSRAVQEDFSHTPPNWPRARPSNKRPTVGVLPMV